VSGLNHSSVLSSMFKQGGRLLRAWTRGQDICRTLHHRRVSVTKPGLDCVQAEIRNGLDIPIVGQLLCHERGHNRCQITIREPETNFYVRILFPLAPFSRFLVETTAREILCEKLSVWPFL
jgi:hypothetical protein